MTNIKWPLAALALAAPVAFIGCGGGGNSNNPKTIPPTAVPVPSPTVAPGNSNVNTTNFVGLQSNGLALVTFVGSAPQSAVTRAVTGLPAGVILRGIDARVAPSTDPASGTNGVSAIYVLGTNDQLYTLNLSGTGNVGATAVGSPAVFTGFILQSGAYGFDVNPAADRLRVVSGTQNSRINPNTGAAVDGDATTAGTQPDGTLTYDTGDVNAGTTANITAAGYTNNDANPATGTVNYGIDTNLDILVTQGRPASGTNAAVSPNTGTLFTVGSLGTNFPNDAGLEVFGNANTAVAVGGQNFYTVNLASGAATNIGTINSSADIIDITVAL